MTKNEICGFSNPSVFRDLGVALDKHFIVDLLCYSQTLTLNVENVSKCPLYIQYDTQKINK